MTPPAIGEPITRVAPLGIRFSDAATGNSAGSGLRVAHRGGVAGESPSGVYVLRGLPGLGATERGDGTAAFWAHPPVTGEYRVEVTDPAGRFLPTGFTAAAPTRGLFAPACVFSAPETWRPPLLTVPLFSTAARPVPAGMAVVRAQLEQGGVPRPWAVLEVVAPDGKTRLGVADGNGLVTVLLPYPEPPRLNLSAAAPATVPLSEQDWTLGVRAYAGPVPVAAPGGIPDLCAVLGQPQARLLADEAGTPLTSVLLRYGRELVVRTAGRSSLLIASIPPVAQGSPHA